MPTGKIVPEVKELQHNPTVVYFKRKILKKKKIVLYKKKSQITYWEEHIIF